MLRLGTNTSPAKWGSQRRRGGKKRPSVIGRYYHFHIVCIKFLWTKHGARIMEHCQKALWFLLLVVQQHQKSIPSYGQFLFTILFFLFFFRFFFTIAFVICCFSTVWLLLRLLAIVVRLFGENLRLICPFAKTITTISKCLEVQMLEQHTKYNKILNTIRG